MDVRYATLNDFPEIGSVMQRFFTPIKKVDKGFIEASIEDHHLRIILDNHVIVGFVDVRYDIDRDMTFVNSIGVSRKRQSKIAKALIGVVQEPTILVCPSKTTANQLCTAMGFIKLKDLSTESDKITCWAKYKQDDKLEELKMNRWVINGTMPVL